MKKLNIKNYQVKMKDSLGNVKEGDYAVRESISVMLLNQQLNLSGRDLLFNSKIATKIEDCKDDDVLLEDNEYAKLLSAVEQVHGLGKNEVELVRRVFECPDVKVEEKKDAQ